MIIKSRVHGRHVSCTCRYTWKSFSLHTAWFQTRIRIKNKVWICQVMFSWIEISMPSFSIYNSSLSSSIGLVWAVWIRIFCFHVLLSVTTYLSVLISSLSLQLIEASYLKLLIQFCNESYENNKINYFWSVLDKSFAFDCRFNYIVCLFKCLLFSSTQTL